MNQPAWKAILENRFAEIQRRIEEACRRAGRSPAEVTLVTITKSVSVEVASAVMELGHVHLGENRPQELWRKAAALPAPCQWHLVGHLQRNKIERTLRINPLIHSADSLPLLDALEQEAGKREKTVRILLEVNASGEPAKHGFFPEEVLSAVFHLEKLPHIQACGLMTMAALEKDPQKCRPTFSLVRQLRNQLRSQLGPAHPWDQLSMGMTNDFEVAVEEGATLVRIGTALFEGLPV